MNGPPWAVLSIWKYPTPDGVQLVPVMHRVFPAVHRDAATKLQSTLEERHPEELKLGLYSVHVIPQRT